MMDPLTRLFDMYATHHTSQMTLARNLLELTAATAALKTIDDRLVKGGLNATEQEHAETQFSASDDRVSQLRSAIRQDLERLIGINFDRIEEANL